MLDFSYKLTLHCTAQHQPVVQRFACLNCSSVTESHSKADTHIAGSVALIFFRIASIWCNIKKEVNSTHGKLQKSETGTALDHWQEEKSRITMHYLTGQQLERHSMGRRLYQSIKQKRTERVGCLSIVRTPKKVHVRYVFVVVVVRRLLLLLCLLLLRLRLLW